MSARQTALELASLKAVKDHVAKLDKETKAKLLDDLDPGDRKGAILPDGTEVGAVYVTKQGEAAWKVVDERAFLEWVKAHRPTAIVEKVRESDQTSILDGIKDGGEIPDGVELSDGKAPFVGVRQSAEQAAAVVAAWRRGALALPSLAGEIEK